MKDKFKSGEIIKIKFGEPTMMERYEGYWESPKEILGTKARLQLVDTNKCWSKENVKIVGDFKAEVLSVERVDGYNAGTRIIALRVK